MGEREQSIARQIAQRVRSGQLTHNIRIGEGFDAKEVAGILHGEGIHIDSWEQGVVNDVPVFSFQTSRYEGEFSRQYSKQDHLKEAERHIKEAREKLDELKRDREKGPFRESSED